MLVYLYHHELGILFSHLLSMMPFEITILQFVAFLDLLAVGLIVPLIPNHVKQMGASQLYIGLMGSTYACFQLGSGPLIGSLSDVRGRKPVLLLTLLVCSVTYMALGLTSSLAIILVLRAVLGLFKQTQLLTKALVPDYEKRNIKQSQIYGRMAAISGVGITIGPIIGGHVVEDCPVYGFTVIGAVVSFFFLVNAACINELPKTENFIKSKQTSKEPQNFLQSLLSCSKQSFAELSTIEWSKYWKIFIFQALNSFAMGIYYSSYAIYLKTQFGLTPKYIGYVVAIQGVVGAISSYMMGRINKLYGFDKDYSIRNNHVFLLLSMALLGICLARNIYMYAVLLIPLATGNAVGRLVTLEMVLKRCKGEHRGTLIGASNSVRSLTGVVAPIVAGFIGEFIGMSYVLYASFLPTFIGLILSYQYKTKTTKVE